MQIYQNQGSSAILNMKFSEITQYSPFIENIRELHRFYYRSSHRRRFEIKGVLRNFSKFKGKQLCRSVFLLQAQTTWKFIKKHSYTDVFL